jgi:hypothetical protein
MLRLILCEEAAKSSCVDELMDRVKADEEEGQVDVVGGTCFVGLLDYALHVCRTRAHFRRKLLLAPLDLDFVLRHSIENQQCCLYNCTIFGHVLKSTNKCIWEEITIS